MSAGEEPSYLAFDRMHVNDGHVTSPAIVRELVARIDRDAAALANAKPTNEQTAAIKGMERIQETMDAMFRHEAGLVETMGQIAQHLGAYSIERI